MLLLVQASLAYILTYFCSGVEKLFGRLRVVRSRKWKTGVWVYRQVLQRPECEQESVLVSLFLVLFCGSEGSIKGHTRVYIY